VIRKRLDELVVERGLADSRNKAQAMIMAGEILVNNGIITKPGSNVQSSANIVLKDDRPRYVSRGGVKLEGALSEFKLEPKGWICLDVGASTGGFTDCLLHKGAIHVFTLDVGKGQLDPKIRHHPHVAWKEGFHVKDLVPEMLSTQVDLAVVDVSFISLRKALPFVVPCIKSEGYLLALVKPQFEATRKDVAKGGILKNEGKRQQILASMTDYARDTLHLRNVRTADSVLAGMKGNREVFLFGQK
jgi:23S rRNA (cytidine1920-2'-O)/16S rRNA (cytidine1409-2'-O)-methyltransferase